MRAFGIFNRLGRRFRWRCRGLDHQVDLPARRLEHVRDAPFDQRHELRKLCGFCSKDARVELALCHNDIIVQRTQFLLDRFRGLRCRRGRHQRLQPSDCRQQLLGVGIAIATRVRGEESASARARGQRIAERMIVALVRRIGQLLDLGGRFGRHVQSLPVPFINHAA